VKFTRRGTSADDCVVALCWAAAREQDIEIARIMESEHLPDFIRSSSSGQSLPVLFLKRERRATFDLSALLGDNLAFLALYLTAENIGGFDHRPRKINLRVTESP
jgi:hypothetical protein